MYANTMYFKDEIQKADDVKKVKIDKKELDLAINLIGQMTVKFEPEKFKDEYTEKLKKAIKRKIAGNEIVEQKDKNEPSNVINLMDALQKSLSGSSKPKAKAGVK